MDQAKKNIFTRMVNYFKDVKAEMKKVVWPSFSKVKMNTLTVIIYVVIVGLVIFGLDALFNFIMSLFY